jgi:hypothetical protein
MKPVFLPIVAAVAGLSVPARTASDFSLERPAVFDSRPLDTAHEAPVPASTLPLQTGSGSGSFSSSLDYEFFKTRVQPIFVARRPGHARCVVCHAAGTPLRLQPLAPGSTTWSEEDSRKNFEAVRRVIVPGSLKSRLLVHPLAEEAGGDFYHSGGKHWSAQDDPEWQTLKAWVLGQTTK